MFSFHTGATSTPWLRIFPLSCCVACTLCYFLEVKQNRKSLWCLGLPVICEPWPNLRRRSGEQKHMQRMVGGECRPPSLWDKRPAGLTKPRESPPPSKQSLKLGGARGWQGLTLALTVNVSFMSLVCSNMGFPMPDVYIHLFILFYV